MVRLHRSWLMGTLLILDALFCSLVLLALFGGSLLIAVSQLPAKGEGAGGLIAVMFALIEWLVLWSVWSKHVPGLRRPRVAVARLLSSPWRLLNKLEFEYISFMLVGFYAMFCALLLNRMLTLVASFF
ncbi:hypothetical protein FJP68_14395 [Pantoea vagans]|nr:hypothetical protein FJP68_14395 [Pantoea vagans]